MYRVERNEDELVVFEGSYADCLDYMEKYDNGYFDHVIVNEQGFSVWSGFWD